MLATIVIVPLQAVTVLLLIWISQAKLDAPPGTEFPYGVLLLFLFVPLLTAIWMRGRFGRKVGAWLAGVICVVVSLLVLYPIAATAAMWGLRGLFTGGDPFQAEPQVLGVYAAWFASGFVPAWMILRRSRQGLAPSEEPVS
jgi:hypothetical protein